MTVYISSVLLQYLHSSARSLRPQGPVDIMVYHFVSCGIESASPARQATTATTSMRTAQHKNAWTHIKHNPSHRGLSHPLQCSPGKDQVLSFRIFFTPLDCQAKKCGLELLLGNRKCNVEVRLVHSRCWGPLL